MSSWIEFPNHSTFLFLITIYVGSQKEGQADGVVEHSFVKNISMTITFRH